MFRVFTPLIVAAAFFGLCQAPLFGAPDSGGHLAEAQRLVDSLNYQKGEITLKGGLAKVTLPSEFRYLDAKDARTVLSSIWGNPPSETLGMLVPADVSMLDPNAWAIVITYDEDGYVKDTDAAKLDYDDLIKKMRESVRAANSEREKQGYPAMELVGWAAPPRYDAASHKLYWAKELKFADSPESTLNYNIRMLGRRGVLVLNAVAPMDKLKDIETATPSILAMVDFQQGNRYTDFNASTDKVATYGLIGLIAGGVLAKAGFFKLLLGAILALKKFAIVAILGAFAAVKKFFAKLGGRGEREV